MDPGLETQTAAALMVFTQIHGLGNAQSYDLDKKNGKQWTPIFSVVTNNHGSKNPQKHPVIQKSYLAFTRVSL